MRTIIRAAITVCVLVGLAACGSGGNNPSPSATPSTMSDAEILTLGKQVADCIRNNGIPDFPDPYVERGKLKLPEDMQQTLEQRYSQQVMDQAEQSCQALMDRIPEAALNSGEETNEKNQEPGPGDVEALKKFAQCMRENGFADWPDPKPDGSFPLRGTALETEGKSERFGTAVGVCQQYWSGGMRIS